MGKYERLPPEALVNHTFDLPEPPRQIDWANLFGNDHPTELEIGCGKGAFLVHAASQTPTRNFAGIEVVRKYQLYTATRLVRHGLSNARICCSDARFALAWSIPTGSLHALHVYFPDPWWKTRHHKRRLVTADFLVWAVRALKPGGTFHLASDVPDYFASSLELLAAQPMLERLGAAQARGFQTNFERKALSKGGSIHQGVWVRAEGSMPPPPPDPLPLFPVAVPGGFDPRGKAEGGPESSTPGAAPTL